MDLRGGFLDILKWQAKAVPKKLPELWKSVKRKLEFSNFRLKSLKIIDLESICSEQLAVLSSMAEEKDSTVKTILNNLSLEFRRIAGLLFAVGGI